jgi:uncharacterized protein YqjF (DUF2071 family)
MAQSWHDLLFMHWPVPVELLQRIMPPKLPVDTFDGQAYIGVVPFRMSGVRPHYLPAVPGISAFPELNVRTYVNLDGRPGVYFFSLDAGSKLAVRVARPSFHLPYFDAKMSLIRNGDEIIYDSERTHEGAPPATLHARYRPVASMELARPGSLEDWLTARYCMYPVDAGGNVYRGEIDHAPWLLQRATAEIGHCTMTESLGLPLAGPPLLHFVERLDVVVWQLQQLMM